jgi:hypothetical protein
VLDGGTKNWNEAVTMKPEERAYLLTLCDRITREQDPGKFTELILQLEVLLDFFHPAEEVKIMSC